MSNMNQIIFRLSEVSKLYAGGDAPKEVSSDRTDEFCYPIFSNGLDNEGLYGYSKKATMKSNTITVSARGTIGAAFYRKEPFLPIVRLITIEPNEQKINSWYLYYYLLMNKLEGYGTSQQQLTIPFMKKKKVLIFENIEYQKKIAIILYNYDQLIENNNKRIKLLEQIAEELYKEWFVRFRFPGYEKTCFVDGIPEGWKYKKFSKCFNTSRGISYSSEEIECEGGMNLINLKNIQSYGGFRRDGTKKYSGKYKKDQTVKYKDLIMGVTDMTQDRRTIGHVALVPNIEGVISADLIKLDSDINNLFWYCLFRYGFYSKMFSQFGNGANVIHLKPQSIKNQKILVPILELIEKFVKKVELIIDEIEILNAKNELLAEQRDLLLPRLMSGKIDLEDKEVI